MILIIEGVTYRASKSGKFYCPRKCHDKSFPAPSWKSEKGFTKHLLESCPELPSKWTAPVAEAAVLLDSCAGCKAAMRDGESIWQAIAGKWCWECYRGGRAPKGYADCMGLVLGGFNDIVG